MFAIAEGAEFHESDDSIAGLKEESMSPEPGMTLATPPPPSKGGTKRPRRSAQSVSYAVPGSDDEAIMGEDEMLPASIDPVLEKKLTNLQKWISALDDLLKSEQRKVRQLDYIRQLLYSLDIAPQLKEYRKKLEKAAQPDVKIRICKVSPSSLHFFCM
jgi:hypothetical protein